MPDHALPSPPTTRKTAGAGVEATGLSVKGPRGWVFQDVDLTVGPGTLTALTGAAGSGRTSLLLTLGGRMRLTSGTALVGGHRLPAEARAVQKVAAIGVMAGVNEPEPALSVREHVSEALDLYEGLWGRLRGRSRRIEETLERVGLDRDPLTLVQDLPPDEIRLLGAALALIGEPRLLLLDDVDTGLAADRQRTLWQRLRGLTESGVTVIAVCHDPAPAAGLAQIVQPTRPREDPAP